MLYRDFQSADAARFGKFFGGCALTFLGVYLITSGRQRGTPGIGDHDDLDTEENTIGMIDEERYQDDVGDGDEADNKRRKSSVSFASEAESPTWRSAKSTTNHGNQSPSTPPPLLSYTSTTSSRFSNAESPLTETPWETPQARPHPLESTISSPMLPSQAQRSDLPATPQAQRSDRLSISKADRPTALSRRSMARLTPGPLMSPLSSPLSAVVADNLRKGMDSPSVRRRPGPGLRQSRSQRTTRASTDDDMGTVSSPSRANRSPQEPVMEQRPLENRRAHNVRATLGEFFRLKRERSRGKAVDRNTNDTQE